MFPPGRIVTDRMTLDSHRDHGPRSLYIGIDAKGREGALYRRWLLVDSEKLTVLVEYIQELISFNERESRSE